MAEQHDLSYYLKCMVGGALACGLTHTAIVPLDVVKCRRQVDPNLYKSLGEGLSTIRRTEGLSGLALVRISLESRVGFQLMWDIAPRVQESLAFMSSSRMSTRESLGRKMLPNIRKSDGLQPQEVLKLQQTPFYVPGRPSRSECRPVSLALSPQIHLSHSTLSNQMREHKVSIKDQDLSGPDKSPIPSLNSQPSNKSSNISMIIF